jgi:hypothetical protein
VHGGGGQAFKAWAEHWAKRGYVSISMDTSGNGPGKKRLANGGPDQSDKVKFRNFDMSTSQKPFSMTRAYSRKPWLEMHCTPLRKATKSGRRRCGRMPSSHGRTVPVVFQQSTSTFINHSAAAKLIVRFFKEHPRK